MKKMIEKALKESIQAKEHFISEYGPGLISFAEKIVWAFTSDHKLMICGNGGSAADAQHLAAEFVNRYQLERPPLPALALTTDTSILLSIGNDYAFDDIFAKQVKALGMEGDILWVLSTSGNSANILSAVETAQKQGIYTVGFAGNDGGKLKKLADQILIVPTQSTPRVQETHILAGHIICQLVDYMLFEQALEERQEIKDE